MQVSSSSQWLASTKQGFSAFTHSSQSWKSHKPVTRKSTGPSLMSKKNAIYFRETVLLWNSISSWRHLNIKANKWGSAGFENASCHTKPPTLPPFPIKALQAIGNTGKLTAGILKFWSKQIALLRREIVTVSCRMYFCSDCPAWPRPRCI